MTRRRDWAAIAENDYRMTVYRKLANLEVGGTARFSSKLGPLQSIAFVSEKFGKVRKMRLVATIEGDKVIVERKPDAEGRDKLLAEAKKMLEALTEPGMSVLYEWQSSQTSSFRAAASLYMREHPGVRIRCSVEPGGIRATRLEDGDEPLTGRPPLDPSQHKYPIADLEVGYSTFIKLPPTEYAKIRRSVSAHGQRYGKSFQCNVIEGGMLVKRTA